MTKLLVMRIELIILAKTPQSSGITLIILVKISLYHSPQKQPKMFENNVYASRLSTESRHHWCNVDSPQGDITCQVTMSRGNFICREQPKMVKASV